MMKPTEHMASHSAEAATQMMAEAEAEAEALEVHRRQKQPVVVAQDSHIVWLRPEATAPRPVPGDDEPLPEDIEL